MSDERKTMVSKQKSWISPAICAGAAFAFFFSIPMQLYLQNIDEFWFSLGQILPVTLFSFAAAFAIVFLISLLLRGSAKRMWLVLLFGIGLALYIQGNLLPNDYGVLDGREIDWSQYQTPAAVSLFVWVCCLFIPFVIIIFFKQRCLKAFAGISAALVGIQLVSVAVLLLTTPMAPAATHYISTNGMFELSKGKNILVFITDYMDERYLDDVLKEEPDFFNDFKGFTYYHNSGGAYTNTKGSLPFILTGKYYYNDIPLSTHIDNAWKQSELFKSLGEAEYDVAIYTSKRYFASDKTMTEEYSFIINYEQGSMKIKSYTDFASLLYRFSAFRCMPDALKQHFVFYSADFDSTAALIPGYSQNYYTDDPEIFRMLRDNNLSLNDTAGSFRVYHLNGSHAPYVMDADGNRTEDGNVTEQTKGVLNLVKTYISYMEELSIFGDAAIIIMADHGHLESEPTVPVMLYKPSGETGSFKISNAPISQADLYPTLLGELTGEPQYTQKALNHIGENALRDRLVYHYTWDSSWDSSYLPDIYEYTITGDVNYPAALAFTGRIFTSSGQKTYEFPVLKISSSADEPLESGDLSPYFFNWANQAGNHWTINQKERFCFRLEAPATTDLVLRLWIGMVYNDSQRLAVYSQGNRLLASATLSQEDAYVDIPLPNELLEDTDIQLIFMLPNAVSPTALGTGNDVRELGLLINGISLYAQ